MLSSWRRTAAERYAVPVEMRFIDMFMAALGALIFMAMLLAFLMRFLKGPESLSQSIPQNNGAFQILTKTLPSGTVGEPYEVAFAYRGGRGAVSWKIESGAQEIQAGMTFDSQHGVLSGTPTKTGKIRFVLIARDNSGTSDEKPYELALEPARQRSGPVERRFAITLLVVLALVWLFALLSSASFGATMRQLEEAYAQGETQLQIQTSPFTKELIELPGGIETYKGRHKASRNVSRFLFVLLLVLGLWFYWMLKHG